MKKQQPLLILGAGLALIAMVALGSFLVFGNNADEPDVEGVVKETIPSVSASGTVGGRDAIFSGAPSKASINLAELPPNYEVDVSQTFTMTVSTFSSSYWFKTDAEGQAKAKEWVIADGFQVFYQPEGLFAEVLKGSPYIHVETYQFGNVEGAKKAWAHFDALLSRTVGSDPVEAKALANNSSAYRYIEGTIGTSSDVAVYHRYSFRRGNMIVSVVTWGGDKYMNIDPARNIAASIDDKLLGTRPAVEPTPIPTPAFPGLGN